MKFKILKKSFYMKDAAVVAQQLLGKFLVRKLNGKKLTGKIVETEAYYGKNDPASRAFTTPKMASQMWNEGGRTFVYMVHNNWLLNIVTGKKGTPSAVLIRAVEPIQGINIMKNHRKKDGFLLTNGPGKLTKAMRIDKKHHDLKVYDKKSNLIIIQPLETKSFTITSSHRIGVKKDLKQKLRFYIKNNPYVSRK
ncbi:MAG: DNA-3-methyladenine glycosylase [Candidatus Pacearchaeota archaeon]